MQSEDLVQDRYVLQHQIGRGGMAEVWCARDRRLDRPVAVKFLAPQFHDDPEFLVRFFSEAQSVARISHANVVGVLDFGDFSGHPYLVMEYVPGGSVADLTGAPVAPERAVAIVEDAARGAGAAHTLGLVHRDIKPGNILLDEDGAAKLADFGIASSLGSEPLTATGQAIGSPHYLSPEQASGAPVTPRSDVYSLGVVLYELVTGIKPFDADNVTAIAIAHVDREPSPPGELVEGLDPGLEALILRCLAKDPEERFADGTALAEALDHPEKTVAVSAAAARAEDQPPATKRLGLAAIISALLVAVLAAGVWATTRDRGAQRPRSQDQEVVDEILLDRRRPRPTTSAVAPVTDTSSPSPTPTGSPTPKSKGGADSGRSGGGGGGSEHEPKPVPTDPPPTSEPTTAPSADPTPAPTGQDAPAPTP